MANNEPITQIRTASGINVLLGSLLISLPWLLRYPSWEIDLTRNSIIVGALIVMCALVRVAHPRSKIAWSIINITLGFWTLISPPIFGNPASASGWLGLAVGAAVIASAAWSANAVVDSEGSQHA